MAEITYRSFERLGAPQWSEEAKRFAREVQRNLGLEPMSEPFLDKTMVMTPPWEAEEAFRKELPAWQMNYAADDYVDYSWHAPTVRLYVAPMYFYKSAKWLSGITVTEDVKPGYWEHRGYDVDGWVGRSNGRSDEPT